MNKIFKNWDLVIDIIGATLIFVSLIIGALTGNLAVIIFALIVFAILMIVNG